MAFDEEKSVNLFRHFERSVVFRVASRTMVPVTLVCGALGAGCTTLLRHLLQNKRNLLITAIINDFAAVNIDQKLVSRSNFDGKAEIHELSNGCMCCVARVEQRFEDVVGEVLNAQHINTPPDAIVIETSGVTDPERVIAKLEQRFGKTSRCRLDSVITVVDCDALHANLLESSSTKSPLGAGAFLSQLHCGDLIVLNKTDLVTAQQIIAVKAFVKQENDTARIFETSFCELPLHYILDIEPPSKTGIVAHESKMFEQPLAMSSTGGALRRHRELLQTRSNRPSSLSSSHQLQDNFNAVVYESYEPFHLSAFQDWLAFHFPVGLVRMKGIVWFHCQRCIGSEFQVSGRRRYFFELGETPWIGRPQVCLALIGRELDCDAIQSALAAVCVSRVKQLEDSEMCRWAQQFFLDDALFELAADHCVDASLKGIVRFRLTGSDYFQISVTDLEYIHGVDFNAMNRQFLQTLNSCGNNMFFTSVWVNKVFFLQWSTRGRLRLHDLVAQMKVQALQVLKRCTAHIQACKCGF